MPGVCSIHDVHIWCVTPQLCTMSGHIILSDDTSIQARDVLSQVNHVLAHDYGIEHTTIQIEDEHCGHDDVQWMAAK